MKDFKGKFERLKEKLQNEEKSKLSLITEQKELVLKYKQVKSFRTAFLTLRFLISK
jgi:predicted nuclease with TOPRIM domain